MKVVADTGPLVAAANRAERAYELAADLVSTIGRDLLVPAPVAFEVDQLLRSRLGAGPARLFLAALIDGSHTLVPFTHALLRRSAEIDDRFGDLELGLADASVMAIAEEGRLPILTFDFRPFRATRPARGFWRLVVDEARLAEATGRG